MILLFQGRHGRLLTSANGVSLPFSVGARGVRRVKLWASFINSSNQESHTIGPGHGFSLAAFVSLTEVDSEVRDRLGNGFDSHGLIEVECVVRGLYAAMIDENAGITNDSTHGTSTMTVHLDKLFAAA